MANYSVILRNLNSFENILAEIDDLDLFNCPEQFDEINDQLYFQYGLKVKVYTDTYYNSGSEFYVENIEHDVVFESEYGYSTPLDAQMQALREIAAYIEEEGIEPAKITRTIINGEIKFYEEYNVPLPHYIKRNN